MAIKEIRQFAPRSIFVEVDLDEMLRRRMLRDTRPENKGGRGRTVVEVADEWPFVKQGHLAYVLPTRRYATMTIDNSFLVDDRPKALTEIMGIIKVWLDSVEILNRELAEKNQLEQHY